MLKLAGHRNGSDVGTFSNQIDDGPMLFSPLDVFQAQLR
jgi:hypothetical protein